MEAIKVNLIPNGIPEACHASQYDEGRQIRLDLFDGLTPYTIQAGDTFTLNVRKPDNHVITETVTGTEGNTYLVIDTTEQMTAVTGENLCEIRLENDGDNIGSLNFIMQVEKDVIANGIPSESVIEDLETLVVEAVGDNYYTKTETDELLAQKADESELLNILPTDTASGAIANFTDGADNIPVKALSVEFSASQASGTPTPAAPIPIVGVDKVNITRTGKNLLPSLSSAVTVNQITFSPLSDGAIDINGTASGNASVDVGRNEGCFLQSGTYFVNITTAPYTITVFGIVNGTVTAIKSGGGSFTLTKPTQIFVRVFIASGTTANHLRLPLQLELGSTATEYEPYNGTTALINLGGTYYGGSVDAVTGKITNRIGSVDLGSLNYQTGFGGFYSTDLQTTMSYGTDTNVKPDIMTSIYKTLSFSEYDESTNDYEISVVQRTYSLQYNGYLVIHDSRALTGSELKTLLNGITLYYPLATPIVVYASNTAEIPTILGNNNFFSDAGDVDVTIRADIALYIQKMLGGNANRSLGANPSILRAGAISTDIEVREPVEPDSEPVELEGETTEQPENEDNDNEER